MPKISKATKPVKPNKKAPTNPDTDLRARIQRLSMKPYQQGAFDGFCGLYAVINATRLVSYPSDGIGEEFCDELFTSLLRHATLRIGVRQLAQHGTPRWLMRALLGSTSRFLQNRKTMTLEASRFLFGKGHLPLSEVLHMMRSELAAQRCAFVVELSGMHCHWSVIRNVSEAQIHLFDSDGLKVLNTSDIRMSYDPKRHSAKHVLVAGSVFMLKRS